MSMTAEDKTGGRQNHLVPMPSSAVSRVLAKMAAMEVALLDHLEVFDRHVTERLRALEPRSCPQRERPPRS